MPGAFAHMIAADQATSALEQRGLKFPANALNSYNEWLQSGTVGPDYPYLHHAINSHDACVNWANQMHYVRSGDMVRGFVKRLRDDYARRKHEPAYQRTVAWVFGYASHVMLDASIHPVVRAIVGEYEQNKTAHRTCEMYMDAYIYKKTYGVELINAEWADYLRHVSVSNGKFDSDVVTLWRAVLEDVHPEEYARNRPQIEAWHDAYVGKLDEAEIDALFFRHATANNGSLYVERADIPPHAMDIYIENVALPATNRFGRQTMHYEDVFRFGVNNVVRAWIGMAHAIDGTGDLDLPIVLNWDLDKGTIDPAGTGDATLWV